MFMNIANTIVQFTNDFKVVLIPLAVLMSLIGGACFMIGSQRSKAFGTGIWVAVGTGIIVTALASTIVNTLSASFTF